MVKSYVFDSNREAAGPVTANQYSFQNTNKNSMFYDDSLFNLIDEI